MPLEVSLVPNHGETIFSLLSRAYCVGGIFSPLVTLREYTGHRGYKPLTSLPSNLRYICEKLHLPNTPQQFIRRHTLFNLYKPFIPVSRREFIKEGMLNFGYPKARVGLLKSHCGAADQLAYCSECVKNDVFKLGYPYWRREHLLVGIELCPLHGISLVKINLNDTTYGARNLQLPGYEVPTSKFEAQQHERLLFISTQAAEVTNTDFDVYISSQSYLGLLASNNYVTKYSHLRMRALVELVREWLQPLAGIHPYDNLLSALDIERNWVANLVAGKEGMHHPIKHIVLWGALKLDYFSLTRLRQSVQQYSLNLELPAKLTITKETLLAAVEKYRSATKCARALNCSVNTVLALMEKYGLAPNRKPKKLNSDIIGKVITEFSHGRSTAQISRQLELSVSTINRIKRAYYKV